MPQTEGAPAYADLEFFASCLAGAEQLLADELHALGVRRVRPLAGGAAFFGQAADALAVCLWSRIASRVLAMEGRVAAGDADALYAGVRALPWEQILLPGKSLAVRAHGTNGALRNTRFTGQRVKDAVCDRLRAVRGERPSVNVECPDLAIDVRVRGNRATVSVDLSGRSLAERAYLGPRAAADAPLRVSYAAALLALAGWSGHAAEGWGFLDAGASETAADGGPAGMPRTILEREAAAVAADEAPGAARDRWGFFAWGRFDEDAWGSLLDEADERAERGSAAAGIAGESAPRLIAALLLDGPESAPAAAAEAGAFASVCAVAPAGSAFVLVGGEEAAARFGAAPAVGATLGHGRIEVPARVYDAPPSALATVRVPDPAGGAEHEVSVLDVASAQFSARLAKVARERRKWARRDGASCYRVYDADLPEYAVAVDLYAGAGPEAGERYLHIAEYAPPKSVDEAKARRRLSDALALAPVVLGVPADHVFAKTRRREKGGGQYRDAGSRPFVVHVEEDGSLLEVDLSGYVDTGIFLDHRDTRRLVGQMASGTRFLNLFAYTGTATVHAAVGGAASTCTVDLSQTYLDWARRNMEANGFSGRAHAFERADVMAWITEARRARRQFDLVFVDPPTFSNSKAMGKRTWDVQRDHVELLIGVSRLLAPAGTAVFSCNLRTFKPDEEALFRYGVALEDITARTIPHDFERNPRIHRCYLVRRSGEGPSRA